MKSHFFRQSLLLRFLSLAFLLSFTNGCTILNLKRQTQEIDRIGIIPAKASGFPRKDPVYVMAFGSGRAKTPVSSERSKDEGLVLFGLPLGRTYDVLAFEDSNRNRRLDHSELKAVAKRIQPRPLDATNLSAGIVALRPSVGDYGSFFEVVVPDSPGTSIPVSCGQVAKVTDPRFALNIGPDGLWRPETSLRASRLGLYMNEPFDPTKTPVVFVHGIGGSPQDFARMIAALDRKKFQAWFFTYPSRLRLDAAASALSELTSLLMEKYRVGRVNIVAHSVGGLIARAAILKMNSGDKTFPVDRFVSISTPFGGYDAAALGTRHKKYPLPSWIDIMPGSDFLKNLWRSKLPYPTRHWLIFVDETSQTLQTGDQTASLPDALYPQAKKEAAEVVGLSVNHQKILQSPETATMMNGFLKSP